MDVSVRGDGSDLSDLGSGSDCFGVGRKEFDDAVDGHLRATTKVYQVATGSEILDAFSIYSAGKERLLHCHRRFRCFLSWTRLKQN